MSSKLVVLVIGTLVTLFAVTVTLLHNEEDKHDVALALVAVPASKDDSPKPKSAPTEENKTNNQNAAKPSGA